MIYAGSKQKKQIVAILLNAYFSKKKKMVVVLRNKILTNPTYTTRFIKKYFLDILILTELVVGKVN